MSSICKPPSLWYFYCSHLDRLKHYSNHLPGFPASPYAPYSLFSTQQLVRALNPKSDHGTFLCSTLLKLLCLGVKSPVLTTALVGFLQKLSTLSYLQPPRSSKYCVTPPLQSRNGIYGLYNLPPYTINQKNHRMPYLKYKAEIKRKYSIIKFVF